MSDDRNTHNGGGWQPHPQGEYDSDATAFVQLPEGMLDTPLAAPGHGYVPPQITVTPTTPDATDPAATGAWVLPPEVTGVTGGGQTVSWPDADTAQQHHAPQQEQQHHGYDPRATGQWSFTEGEAAERQAYGQGYEQQGQGYEQQGYDPGYEQYGHGVAAPSSDVTGQWSIPVAGGDLPDESGEYTASALGGDLAYPARTQSNVWAGGTLPPATLPGGAPAPWATGAGVGAPWGTPPQEAAQQLQEAAQQLHEAAHQLQEAPEHAEAPQPEPEPRESRFEQTTLLRAVSVPPPGQSGAEAARAAEAAQAAQAAQAADAVEAARDAVETAQEAAEAAEIADVLESSEPTEEFETAEEHDAADTADTADMAPEAAVEPAPEPEPEPVPEPEPDRVDEVRPEAANETAPEATGTDGTPEPGQTGAMGDTDDAAAETAATTGTPEATEATEATESPEATEAPDATEAGENAEAAGPAEAADGAPVIAPNPHHDDHPLGSYVLRVNGTDRPVTDAWIGESLLYVLRERLGLAGAKDGCSQGECGACNVQVDGRLVASCLVPAATTAGSEIRTVEGLAADGRPSDVQRALAACGAVQCGFCVPGMAMTVHDLLEGNPAPSELETRRALCGNLCRCSGYRGVLDAVREVVAERQASAAAETAAAQDERTDEARIPHQAPPGAGGVHQTAYEDGGQA
ncbi:(2Fe-2S)-binding protein [Streptomyces sp. G44]|uniref:(2Fe-2S)-binding protein n=1 Tax=Streptomyces sp. G44 TaxID=2807632 RepID=UPI001960AC28|nr:(2Fe-2S)-binding protein [Streptomyces sp. G44]MBM7169011.1 (2Fe-2S)-binding protein [Streptomyces sp. G44]